MISAASPLTPRRAALTGALILLTMALLGLACRPYLPIDETRYVSVAWEMWLRGDFLVPFKNGEPYSHKPPLLFWVFHAGWAVFGVNEWWPRMVSPLFSFLSLALTWRIAARLWPERADVPYLVCLVLMSGLLWQIYSQAVMFDVMVTAFTLMAILALIEIGGMGGGGGRHSGWIFFIAGIGLGVLTKGPFVILYVAPVAYLAPLWLRDPGMSWQAWYVRITLAFIAGGAIGLAWAIPAGLAGGEAYRQAIFWDQTAHRVSESFAHRRPFWWYAPLLPVVMFPWLAWPGLLKSLALLVKNRLHDSGVRLVLIWFGVAFAALSAASGKQPHYLMQGIPALALLIGVAVSERPPGRPWFIGLALLSGGAVLSVGDFLGLSRWHAWFDTLPAWSGAGLILAGVLVLWPAKDENRVVTRLAVILLALFAGLLAALAPILREGYDMRPIARQVAVFQKDGRTVAHAGNYHDQYQFLGRLAKPLEEIGENTVPDWLRNHPEGVALFYVKKNVDPQRFDPLAAYRFRSGYAVFVGKPMLPRVSTLPAADL